MPIEQQFKRKQNMDLTNISKSTPIEPYIECDGGYYAMCHRCWCEIEPKDKICPECGQSQDWSWFGKSNKNEEVSV